MPTIVVADDDHDITEMLRRTLTYQGYQVVTYASGGLWRVNGVMEASRGVGTNRRYCDRDRGRPGDSRTAVAPHLSSCWLCGPDRWEHDGPIDVVADVSRPGAPATLSCSDCGAIPARRAGDSRRGRDGTRTTHVPEGPFRRVTWRCRADVTAPHNAQEIGPFIDQDEWTLSTFYSEVAAWSRPPRGLLIYDHASS